MKEHTLEAYAKLNLTLDILGRRADGYHEMDMLMQSISLSDTLTLTLGDETRLSLTDERGQTVDGIPQSRENLAWRAADCFFAHLGSVAPLSIRIIKRIPSQAGMAGGSADAAGVLRGLNTLYGLPFSVEALCRMAEEIGSDIPFCVLGGTAIARGRGEKLTPVADPHTQHYVICKPDFGISTPLLFSRWDEMPSKQHPRQAELISCLQSGALAEAGKLLQNVLQPVAEAAHPALCGLCDRLLAEGALGAVMTGSGSAVFGLFPDEIAAKAACDHLRRDNLSVFYAHSV